MLCLVLLEDRRGTVSYQIMRYVRHNWRFQEGLGMGDHRVVAWAAINAEIGEPVRTDRAAGNAGSQLSGFADNDTLLKLQTLKDSKPD